MENLEHLQHEDHPNKPEEKDNGKLLNENSNDRTFESKESLEEKEKTIESIRENLIESVRFHNKGQSKAVEISVENKKLLLESSFETKQKLNKNYEEGFGISPCSDPKENFYDQVWSRDGAQAVGNYYGYNNPKAVRDSLETTFRHQKEDGELPLRVERVYAPARLVPGIGIWLSKVIAKRFPKQENGKREHGIYKGGDLSGGEDTVPATIIATGEFFLASQEGKEFANEHYEQIKKAIEHFKTKIDNEDGLAVVGKSPDWAETIRREGKVGTVNVWWARSLRLMEFMSGQLGQTEDAENYKIEFDKVKKSILEKLYDKEGSYFRTKEGEDRVDTVASIFGALYLLSPNEAVKLEETLSKRVKHSSGLVNFDPPYDKKDVFWVPKLFGNGDYHNKFVWPWVTCQNIQVKIKIAIQHEDEAVREKYKKEAVEDICEVSKLFKDLGGAYEIVKPDTAAVPKGIYSPPKNLMGSMAAYNGAYDQLKKLGWVE